MNGRVAPVLRNGLRADEGGKLELLDVGALRRRGGRERRVRNDEARRLPRAPRTSRPLRDHTSPLLRELQVVEAELVGGGHVCVVDGERTLQVELRALHVVLAARRSLRAVTRHLHRREVDERRHVLELSLFDGALERGDRAVGVGILLEAIEREARERGIKRGILLRCLLKAEERVLVVFAALEGEPRVERGLDERPPLRGRRGFEHRGDRGAAGRVPVVCLVVMDEARERILELLQRFATRRMRGRRFDDGRSADGTRPRAGDGRCREQGGCGEELHVEGQTRVSPCRLGARRAAPVDSRNLAAR